MTVPSEVVNPSGCVSNGMSWRIAIERHVCASCDLAGASRRAAVATIARVAFREPVPIGTHSPGLPIQHRCNDIFAKC